MVGAALAGIVTGASSQYLERDKEERVAKAAADAALVKRMQDMAQFKYETDYKLQEKEKYAIKEEERANLKFQTLAAEMGVDSAHPVSDIAMAYLKEGKEAKAREVLFEYKSNPSKYAAREAKDTASLESGEFAKSFQVKFPDGTFDDVVKGFDESLLQAGTSPIKSTKPEDRLSGKNNYINLTKNLIAPSLKEGKVGTTTANELKTIGTETIRTVYDLKTFLKNGDAQLAIQSIKSLEAIAPSLQNVYDPTGANDFNIFRIPGMFDKSEMKQIYQTIKDNPDQFPELTSDIQQGVKKSVQDKEQLQSKATTTPQYKTGDIVQSNGEKYIVKGYTPDGKLDVEPYTAPDRRTKFDG